MTETDGNVPLVQFIREGDSEGDAFGAHSRLACAMQDALEADPTLEVIGLFGSWGSGKSKVVKMLEARMAKETTFFFTYDAWVHQSDAPRRAFLEAFIRFLGEKKLVEAKNLQDSLGKLLKKTEIVEVSSRPEVSIGFGLILALLLLSPVSGQFLRADWRKPSVDEYSIYAFGMEYSTYFAAAFWISLLPFLILIAITIYRIVEYAKGKRVGGGLTALFANRAQEVRTDLKRTDPEPTALEFQRFFRELLDLVEKSGGQRLLFVIDNLDRLPDQELMTLWSSIRTLFHGDEKPFGRRPPTLLLPIDFGAVERVYDKEGVAQGFADKTFDLVFRLPPPINSLWQEYLRARIVSVFPGHAKQEWFEVAARVLEDADVDGRLPRAINIYVNELATLWLQWRNEDVSFAAIAYYAANRVQIEAQPWRALQQVAWMAEFDVNWTRGVAALRYGVPPPIAAQILIEQPLRDAIEANDRAAFLELSRHEGFGTVLRRAVEAYRSSSTGLSVTRTALLLAELDPRENHSVRLAWSCLADGIRTDSWDARTVEDAEALSLILTHAGQLGRARARSAVRDKLRHRHEADTASRCSSVAQAIRIAAQSAKDDGVPFSPIAIAGGAGLAAALGVELGRDASLVEMDIETGALAAELITYSVSATKPLQPLIEAIVAWQPSFPWSTIVDMAVSAMEERNATAASNLCGLLGEIWRVIPSARSKIKYSLGGGIFLDRLTGLAAVRDVERAARITAALLLSDEPQAWLTQIWDDLHRDDRFPARIDDWLSDFASDLTVDHLLGRAAKTPQIVPLVQAIVRRRSTISPVALGPAAVAKRLNLYLQVLPPDVERTFWHRVMSASEFWKNLAKQPYAEHDLSNAKALRVLVGSSSFQPKARAYLAERLNAAPASEWQASLEVGGPLYDELSSPTDGFTAINGATLVEGLTRSATLLVERADPEFERRWFDAATRLTATSQKFVYRTLSNRMLEAGARRPVRLLRAGGRPLLKALRAPKRAELILRRIVVPSLGSPSDVQWLAKHATAIGAAIQQAPESARALSISEIDRRIGLSEQRTEYREALTRLSEVFKSLPAAPVGR